MKPLFKLTPVALLTALMICGYDILIAAPIAFACSIAVAMIADGHRMSELIDAAIGNLHHFLIVFLILQLAYGVAESFMTTGVAASAINIALSLGINGHTVALVGFISTGLLSIATGTSWGTFAACAPIFLWLNHIIGGDPLLAIGAIAGGSCFGDNIGLISDTTVVSSGLQGVEIIKRVRHQGVWSLLTVAAGAIVFYAAGAASDVPAQTLRVEDAIAQISPEVWEALAEQRPSAVTLLEQVRSGVPFVMVVPFLIVLALAVLGTTTIVCLGSGMIASLVFGLAAGTVTDVSAFVDTIYSGFSSAGRWSIPMMLWIGAFGGVMNKMDAFRPIASLTVRVSRRVRHLMTCNALLCLFANAALADEMAQIVTIGPIIKNVTMTNVEGSEEDLYKLSLRNATFSDAMGVLGSQLIPWHTYMGYFIGISAAVYPLAADLFTPIGIITHNYYAWIAVISMLVLTFTGLDRYIPMFGLPSEPRVKLRSL